MAMVVVVVVVAVLYCQSGQSRHTCTVTGMPQPLRDANLAPRWWPASATNTFVLFTMKDASMSYHIDLWATAVLYAQ